MKFTQNNGQSTTVFQFSTDGALTLSGYYEENNLSQASQGNLSLTYNQDPVMVTAADPLGDSINIKLENRLFDYGVLDDAQLVIKYQGTKIAGWSQSGSLLLGKGVSNVPPDPADDGAFNVQSVVYALANLDYSSFPNDQYNIFQNPSNDFTTRSIDLSDFVNRLGGAPGLPPSDWPFTVNSVPINGLLRIPIGNGPFPLALFAHGNHTPLENSTPGYIYMCNLLASQGIIAGTIDANFLNGDLLGENAARAILHLEQIKQFRIWNQQVGHPLQNKVDLRNVMIIGHSRGGEAVAHASTFNHQTYVVPAEGDPDVPLDGTGRAPLGPYFFGLKAVLALAPTEGQYKALKPFYPPEEAPAVVEDPYLVMHGSRDGDVFNFPGYLTYDRAQPTDNDDPAKAPPGIKSLLWIYGANHNYFNTVWLTDDGPATITRDQQELIAKVYVASMAQAQLLNHSQYLDVLKNHLYPQSQNWTPNTITFINQYQDNQRQLIQDFENVSNIRLTPPVTGTVDTSSINALKLYFDLGDLSYLYEATGGLRLRWQHSGERYIIEFQPALDHDGFQYLVLRAGQSPKLNPPEDLNVPGNNQDFSIVIEDGVQSLTTPISAWQILPYPDDPSADVAQALANRGRTLDPKMVMQTVRIPLSLLQANGLNLSNIEVLKLLMDKVNSGIVYVDDIQLSF